MSEDASTLQIESVHQDSILVTDYLTKIGIKTVSRPPYSPDLASCDFCLFPKLKEKLRGCRYETIEEMKEAMTKVIDTLTGLPWGLPEVVGTSALQSEEIISKRTRVSCVYYQLKCSYEKKSGNLLCAPCK